MLRFLTAGSVLSGFRLMSFWFLPKQGFTISVFYIKIGVLCFFVTVQSQAQICEETLIQLAEIHVFSQICIWRARRNSGNGIFSPFPESGYEQLR